ncbi:MAG: hypothetical protein JNK61_12750 [Bacteroidia bacterium]|nr:hypothetical protein [Bacteroidia bacterium]
MALSLSMLSFTKPAQVHVFTPTGDFSYLKKGWVLSRCVTVAHWETDPVFSFDDDGIIMNKKTYHPVVISQYALTVYDAWQRNGSAELKTKFLNQIKYLSNPKFYTQINDTVVAYPYTVNFHDLRAPWYSGLAQAEVLGVLVRYYAITQDKTILPLMVKIKNMMTLPVSKGGLLNTTAEGNVWIEEYPNSAQHLHVLNGFMVTALLLDDYSRFFPADIETRKLVDDCFASVKAGVGFYDTGYGLRYDRGTAAAVVNNWYMKAQVIEIDQLYEVTGDLFFKKASMLWATYCYNKIIGFKGCIIDSVNYSIPIASNNNTYSIKTAYNKVFNNADISRLIVNRNDSSSGLRTMVDGNLSTTAKMVAVPNAVENPFVEITLNNPVDFNQLQVWFKSNTCNITLHIKEKGKDEFKKVSGSQKVQGTTIIMQAHAQQVIALRIGFDFKPPQAFDISDISFFKEMPIGPSDMVHIQTTNFKVDKISTLTWNDVPKTDYVVFYKTAPTEAQLNNVQYQPAKATFNQLPKLTEVGQYVTFLVVLKRNNKLKSLSDFRLQ